MKIKIEGKREKGIYGFFFFFLIFEVLVTKRILASFSNVDSEFFLSWPFFFQFAKNFFNFRKF